jgi:hypothetical protein
VLTGTGLETTGCSGCNVRSRVAPVVLPWAWGIAAGALETTRVAWWGGRGGLEGMAVPGTPGVAGVISGAVLLLTARARAGATVANGAVAAPLSACPGLVAGTWGGAVTRSVVLSSAVTSEGVCATGGGSTVSAGVGVM